MSFIFKFVSHIQWVLFFLAGSVSIQLQASSPAEVKELRIAVVANASSGELTFGGVPQVIARDQVFKAALAEQNIKLQWVPVSTAAVATLVNESFAGGKIDFAFYGDLPSVILNASGIETRLVVSGSVGNNSYLVVPKHSTAASIRDLKGKRIALHRGRPWEATFAKLIESEGLQLKDFRIINLNPQAGAAAVSAGNVEGFFTLSDAHALVEKEVAKIIWSTKDAPVSWRMRAELWGAREFVEQHPEVTQLLATATVRAMHWVSQEENKDAYIAEQSRMGLPEKLIRRDILDERISWRDYWSPVLVPSTTAHYQDVIDHALANRLIRKPVKVDDLLAPQFVSRALQTLELENYWRESQAQAGAEQPGVAQTGQEYAHNGLQQGAEQ